MAIQKRARIRKLEKERNELVICQGCGERIRETDDLEQVEYVKTKRGDEFFFHAACAKNVWSQKIRWEKG